MPYLSLWFPRITLELALKGRPALRGRAIAFVDGAGPDATVVNRSPEAAARGVFTGMPAGVARRRFQDLTFLPSNSSGTRGALAELATACSEDSCSPVSVLDDSLVLKVDGALETAVMRSVLLRAETFAGERGLSLSTGVGDDVEGATAAARHAGRSRRPALARVS